MDEEQYVDTDYAVKFLQVSRATLQAYIREKKLTAYTRVGNKNWFLKSDLQALKEARAQFRPKTLAA